jgi:hypothetical protein
VRANDYKIKFFEFLAENLRRLATRLSVKPPLEEDDSNGKEPASALEDWLARVRKVSPENWVDFAVGNETEPQIRENEFAPESGAHEIETAIRESESEPEIQPPDSSFANEASEDFIRRKSKNQTPIKTFFENRRKEALKTREIFDNRTVSNKSEAFDNPAVPNKPETSETPETFPETEILNKFEFSNESEASAKSEIFDDSNISNKSETSVKNEAFPAEKPKKSKTGARFFSFKTAGEKRDEETVEPLAPLSETSRQASAKDEKPLATAKRNFRLSATEFAFENKPKTSASEAPDIINFVENQPPQFEIPTFEQKDSAAIKAEEIAAAKPKNTGEKPERIVVKPRGGREISERFPLESFAAKNQREATKISFELPKRKTDSAAAPFAPKIKQAPDAPVFSSPAKKSKSGGQKYFQPEREKEFDEQSGDTGKFDVAESPWAELPDETAFKATEDIQINLSENERRRFLEGEQAGKFGNSRK